MRGREMAKPRDDSKGCAVYSDGYRRDDSPGGVRQGTPRAAGPIWRAADPSGRKRVRVTPRSIAAAAIGSYGTSAYKRLILGISGGGIATAAVLIVDAISRGR